MVLRVGLEMFGQVVDAFAEDCDLDFRGSGVAVVGLVAANQLGLAVFAQGHLFGSSTCAPEACRQPDAPYTTKSVTRARSTCYLRITEGCKRPGVSAGSPSPTRSPASSSRRTRCDWGLGIGDLSGFVTIG